MTKLVNLGSACIDHVYRVERICVAGETVFSKSYEVFPGGKGLNQSIAAARAGAEVLHFGCVGEDGRWLREVLTKAGVDASGVEVQDSSSGQAVIQVDDAGQNAIFIVGGTNRQVSSSLVDAALAAVGPDDWLLLQNEINDLELVFERAKARDINVAFNLAPVDGREQSYDLDAAVDVLFVNEHEAAALSGTEEPTASLERLNERFPQMQVVLTLGRDGVRYAFDGIREELRAFKVDSVDETAAGDSFIGYFMASLLEGNEIGRTLASASAAGALAVTKKGAATAIPYPEEVETVLKQYEYERS